MMNQRLLFLVLASILVISGCNLPGYGSASPTFDEGAIITAAAGTAFQRLTEMAGSPSETKPAATATKKIPTITPEPVIGITPVPVDAICLSNAQVRSWPGNGGESYGGVLLNRGVKVLARSLNGVWFLINFADSPTGIGWVRMSAFKLNGDVALLPIALESEENQITYVAPPLWTAVSVPLPLPTLSNDSALRPATLIFQANVRICPNKSCMAIGTLSVGAQIIMTGRYGQNEWAQFLYPSGPGGKGWVSRDLIQPSAAAFGGLPYFDSLGIEITPEPPTYTPDPNMSPTPTKTPPNTPAGPIAVITEITSVYRLQSSLSPVIGTLNPKDRIHITRQSDNGLWFEIQYPADTTGRGYISSKYVSMTGDYRKLPYSDARGTPYP